MHPDLLDCLPILTHLHAEHRRLHRSILDLRKADGEGSPELLTLLLELREELGRHFDEEDAGGCFEEAMARCPPVATDVERLTAEHPYLLAELDRLLKRFDMRTKDPAWSADL